MLFFKECRGVFNPNIKSAEQLLRRLILYVAGENMLQQLLPTIKDSGANLKRAEWAFILAFTVTSLPHSLNMAFPEEDCAVEDPIRILAMVCPGVQVVLKRPCCEGILARHKKQRCVCWPNQVTYPIMLEANERAPRALQLVPVIPGTACKPVVLPLPYSSSPSSLQAKGPFADARYQVLSCRGSNGKTAVSVLIGIGAVINAAIAIPIDHTAFGIL